MRGWRNQFEIGLVLLCGFLLISGAGWGQSSVVPSLLAASVGNFNNSIPWSDEAPIRYQQVLLGSEVGSLEIVEIRFRQDEDQGTAFAERLSGVTIVLSSTPALPDHLSMAFSENHGLDATVVYAGQLSMMSLPDCNTPIRVNAAFRAEPWFEFDASTGLNLLIDVTIEAGPELTYFDAQVSEEDGMSRLFCWNSEDCLTTDEAMIADTVGLVTMILGPNIFEDGFETGDSTSWAPVTP
jgi:hypothetical protein